MFFDALCVSSLDNLQTAVVFVLSIVCKSNNPICLNNILISISFFRAPAARETSFIEKMKKTVSMRVHIALFIHNSLFCLLWCVVVSVFCMKTEPHEHCICVILSELRKVVAYSNLFSFYNQGKNIVVFYGSQTGTAEEFANRLSKDSQRYGMKGMAADPEEYDMVNTSLQNHSFSEKAVIIRLH